MYERHCNIEGKGQAKAGMSRHHLLQHSTAQHSTAQHSTAQHSTAQHSTAQHSSGYSKVKHSIQPMTAGDSMHSRRQHAQREAACTAGDL